MKKKLPYLIPAIDLVLVIIMLLLALNTLTGRTLGKVYKSAPAIDRMGDNIKHNITELERLNQQCVLFDPKETGELKAIIPPALAGKANRLEAMMQLPEALLKLGQATADLSALENKAWLAHLRALAGQELAFWNELLKGLCDDKLNPPPLAPAPPSAEDRTAWALYVQGLKSWEMEVWERYVKCQEPKTEVIGEDLLHFKTNRWGASETDDFENDLEGALKTIYGYVDKHLPTHNHIYVIGYTDPRGGQAHNEDLSYHRAKFVADKIRKYLNSRHKQEAVDYDVYLVGMGSADKDINEHRLKPKFGESEEAYYTRLRRIEITFRSAKR